MRFAYARYVGILAVLQSASEGVWGGVPCAFLQVGCALQMDCGHEGTVLLSSLWQTLADGHRVYPASCRVGGKFYS